MRTRSIAAFTSRPPRTGCRPATALAARTAKACSHAKWELEACFAITKSQSVPLREAAEEGDAVTFVAEIEEAWERDWLVETDNAWDAIHRCLGDGSLDAAPGALLQVAILEGEALSADDEDYLVSYVAADVVPRVATALVAIDDPHGEDDWQYTLESFHALTALYAKTTQTKHAIIFTITS